MTGFLLLIYANTHKMSHVDVEMMRKWSPNSVGATESVILSRSRRISWTDHTPEKVYINKLRCRYEIKILPLLCAGGGGLELGLFICTRSLDPHDWLPGKSGFKVWLTIFVLWPDPLRETRSNLGAIWTAASITGQCQCYSVLIHPSVCW